MSKKILVVGSEGYLGSRLTDYLLELGYRCTGADIGFFRDGVLYRPRSVPTLDVDARTFTEKDIEGFDVVIQLAGISNDPFGGLPPALIYDPTRRYATDIAQICKKLGVRYLFPSSCSVYGIAGEVVDEDSLVNPRTPYSVNKVQIEEDLADLADDSFSPVALRLATVFGSSPRIRFDVVVNMLCGMAVSQGRVVLNSDGMAWRPHVDIDDVCEAFRCCIDWDYKGGKLLVLNIGRDDNNWRILDVARLIQSMVSNCDLSQLKELDGPVDDLVRDRKIVDGADERTYRVCFARAREILPGYRGVWDMETGIDRLLGELVNRGLNEEIFSRREFYRLQHIEYLHAQRRLDSELRIQRS